MMTTSRNLLTGRAIRVLTASVLLFGCVEFDGRAEKFQYTVEELQSLLADLPPETQRDLPVPFRIDRDIQEHVDGLVEGIFSRKERARRILLDIFGPTDLNISYSGYNTKTANEVFRVRYANCLGYTNLYIGMTRHVGIDSYYVEVGDLDDVKLLAAGKAVLVRGHICAGVNINEQFELYDFASDVPKKYKQWRRISDREAMAAFFNNRGVEELFDGTEVDPQGRETAVRMFQGALHLMPGYPPATNNLASVYLIEHDYDRARDLYATIEAKGRSQATVLANIGTTHLLEGDPERALVFYRRAMRANQKDPFVLEKMGVAQEQLGRLQEAVDSFERAAAYHGRFARPHVSLGRIYLKLGDARRAAREYRLALDIDGDNREAQEGLERLRQGLDRPS